MTPESEDPITIESGVNWRTPLVAADTWNARLIEIQTYADRANLATVETGWWTWFYPTEMME